MTDPLAPPIPDAPLSERLEHLRALKEKAAELERLALQAKDDMKQFERQVWDLMADDNDNRSARYGDYTFARKETDYGQITDREAFIAWAKENGHTEFFEEREVKRFVNELVRDALDSGHEFPPGVGFYSRPYISITKTN